MASTTTSRGPAAAAASNSNANAIAEAAAADAAADAFARAGALPLTSARRPGAAGVLLARLDWALVLPLLACGGFLMSYLVRDMAPYPRAVFAADRTIAMPIVPNKNQMPNWVAPFVPGVLLVAAAGLAEFLPLAVARRWPASTLERPPRGALAGAAFVRAVGGMLVALCATSAMTEFLKVFCGRPRPDYLSRCVPKVPATTGANAGTLLDDLVLSAGRGPVVPVECTATDRNAVVESRKSFPSGHSSTAASAGLWGAMYVLHALRRYRGNGAAVPGAVAARAAAKAAAKRSSGGAGHEGGGGANGGGASGGGASGGGASGGPAVPRWARELAASGALLLMLFFLAWPWGVGASRFVDNRHHPSDIVGGLLLGTMMTVPFFFRFEAVSDAWDARDARDPALLLPRPPAAAPAGGAAAAKVVPAGAGAGAGRPSSSSSSGMQAEV